METGKKVEDQHLDAAENVLNNMSDQSEAHATDPKEHIHVPADHDKAHSWFRAVFPYDSLQDLEAQWHLGNYVRNRETGQKSWEPMSIYVRLGMHLLYYGSQQEILLQTNRAQALLKSQSIKMGKQYDTPESKNHIQPFIDSFQLQGTLDELVQPDPTKYSTFNEFFAREMRESARPIAEPDNDKAITSAADCRLTTYPTVDMATKYWIKGFGFTVPKLLKSDELAQTFDRGALLIHRLAPQDYHRWHAPVSGHVESITEIPGTYYTVNPQAINESGTLDVFCENRRSVMIVKRPSGDHVAIIAIGAMLVGSIRYNPGIKEGIEIRRGQCLGAFLYGGSTVITLYPKHKIRIDYDLVKSSIDQECETYMKVGEHVGFEL